jgi:hypothetical protein
MNVSRKILYNSNMDVLFNVFRDILMVKLNHANMQKNKIFKTKQDSKNDISEYAWV